MTNKAKPVVRLQSRISDRPYSEGMVVYDIVVLDRDQCKDDLELYAAPPTPEGIILTDEQVYDITHALDLAQIGGSSGNSTYYEEFQRLQYRARCHLGGRVPVESKKKKVTTKEDLWELVRSVPNIPDGMYAQLKKSILGSDTVEQHQDCKYPSCGCPGNGQAGYEVQCKSEFDATKREQEEFERWIVSMDQVMARITDAEYPTDLSKHTTGEYRDPVVASQWESWYAGRTMQKAKGEL